MLRRFCVLAVTETAMSSDERIAAIVATIAAALVSTYGAARPTCEALAWFGLILTPAAICRRRKRGALPVKETRIGRRYYVTVWAIAELIGKGATVAPATASGIRVGRPRMRAASREIPVIR